MPRGGKRPGTGGSHGGGRPKELEEPVRFYVTLERTMWQQLRDYAKGNGLSLSAVVREAVRFFLEQKEQGK